MVDKIVERQIMETAQVAEVILIKHPVPAEKPVSEIINKVPAVDESPKKPATSKLEVKKLVPKKLKLAAVEIVAPIESSPRDTPGLKVVEAAAQKPVAVKRSAGRPSPDLRLVQTEAAILDTVSDLIAETTLSVKTETTALAVVDDEAGPITSETDTTTPTTELISNFNAEVDQNEHKELGDFLADLKLAIDGPDAEYSQVDGADRLVDTPEMPSSPAERVVDFLSERIAVLEPEVAEQATENLATIMGLVAQAAEIEPKTPEHDELVEQLKIKCAELFTQLGLEYEPDQLRALVAQLLQLDQPIETRLPNGQPSDKQYEVLTDDVFALGLMQKNLACQSWLDRIWIGRVAMSLVA